MENVKSLPSAIFNIETNDDEKENINERMPSMTAWSEPLVNHSQKKNQGSPVTLPEKKFVKNSNKILQNTTKCSPLFSLLKLSSQVKTKTATLQDKMINKKEEKVQTEIKKTANCTPEKSSNLSLSSEKRKKNENSCCVTVAIRVRPFNQRELESASLKCCITMKQKEVEVINESSAVHTFVGDHCFWSFDKDDENFADQQKIYSVIALPLLSKMFTGYNTCLFAYGQTGSGKSYSIMGEKEDLGIIPRFSQDLFHKLEKENLKQMVCIEMSYFEIYNEKIYDLLSSSDQGKKSSTTLRVREHPILGPYVSGLTTLVVSCAEDIQNWLILGNQRRATASTGMNDKSSRSHSVFTIVITQTQVESFDGEMCEHSRKSKINIVDLAGSERLDMKKSTEDRMKEGVSINRSLLTLGRVISQLSELSVQGIGRNHQKMFIPYRESVLTWLLKESLGGNSQTVMLATISPHIKHVEETLNTLRYASKARSIVNMAKINDLPDALLIKELKAEIERLKSQQTSTPTRNSPTVIREIEMLKLKLKDSEEMLAEATRNWEEKLLEAEKKQSEEAKQLEKSGISINLNKNLPYLLNLNEDPQLSEILLYFIQKGETIVGRKSPSAQHDIQIEGNLIAEKHCIFSYEGSDVIIMPQADANTYVNGHLITEEMKLSHGDRIVLGGEHYFRFSYPDHSCQINKINNNTKDFHFARNELRQIQEKRLEEELLKVREKTRQSMIEEFEVEAHKEWMKKQHNEIQNCITQLRQALDEQNLHSERIQQELDAQNKMLELKTDNKEELETSEISPVHTNFLAEMHNLLYDGEQSFCSSGQDNSFLESGNSEEKEYSLYELSVMIKELNLLCSQQGKNIVFSQHYASENSTYKLLIKIHDKQHNIITYWSIKKFQERYYHCKENDEAETLIHLFDASDTWDKEDTFKDKSPTSQQKIQDKRKFFRSLSALSMETSFSEKSNATDEESDCSRKQFFNAPCEVVSTISKICFKHFISTTSSIFELPHHSAKRMTDDLIEICSTVWECLKGLEICYQRNTEKLLEVEICERTILLNISLHHLIDGIRNLIGANSFDINNIEEVKENCWLLLKELRNAVALVFQAIQKELKTLLQEWLPKSCELLKDLSYLLGELLISSNNNSFSSDINPLRKIKINTNISFAFSRGMWVFAEKHTRHLLDLTVQKKRKLQMLKKDILQKEWLMIFQNLYEFFDGIEDWLKTFADFQQEVASVEYLPLSHNLFVCSERIKFSSSYLHHVSSSLDSLMAVLQTVAMGKDFVEYKVNILLQADEIEGIISILSAKYMEGAGTEETESNLNLKIKIDSFALAKKNVMKKVKLLHELLNNLEKLKKNITQDIKSNENAPKHDQITNCFFADSSCCSSKQSDDFDSSSTLSKESESEYSTCSEFSEIYMMPTCRCSPVKQGLLKCELHGRTSGEKTVRFNLDGSSKLFTLDSPEDSIDV